MIILLVKFYLLARLIVFLNHRYFFFTGKIIFLDSSGFVSYFLEEGWKNTLVQHRNVKFVFLFNYNICEICFSIA